MTGLIAGTLLAAAACTATPVPSASMPSAVPSVAAPSPTNRASLAPSPVSTPTARSTKPPTKPPTTPSASPSDSPASAYPDGSMIVTFKVATEEYRVLVTDPRNVAIAQKLLDGRAAPPIPNGVVVRGDPSVNTGWSWHIDPATLEFADVTAEVCDGRPSFVEDGTITSDHFCPWGAKVVSLEPANS